MSNVWLKPSYFPEVVQMPEGRVQGPASYFPSIEKKYGKPISHWLEVLGAMKGKKHMEMVVALKSEHEMGHGHANALVAYHRARSGSE
jgi:uncharacterized protein DUF4287